MRMTLRLLNRSPRARVTAVVAVTAWAAAAAAAVEVPLEGVGLVLPLQDQSGEQATAARVQLILEDELRDQTALVDEERLRLFLRHQRIRNLSTASPDQLGRLAEELGVGWFFSTVLHEAIPGGIPRATVSGSLYSAGSSEIVWSGLAAGSGQETLPWLGLGRVEELEELADLVTGRLMDSLESGALASGASDLPDPVAIVPFNAVTGWGADLVADTVTRAALAGLAERGATVVFPGLVEEVQRTAGHIWRGEIDDAVCEAIYLRTGARWILTGTVEIFESGAGERPEPRVGLSARLLEAPSNEIVWIGGRDWKGSDGQGLFGARRVYSSGRLLQKLVGSLLDESIDFVSKVGGRG